MSAKYDIYEKDGAVFRGPAGMHYVNEVRQGGEWKPYSGDFRAPAAFGDLLKQNVDAD